MSSLERHVTDSASYDEAWNQLDARGDMSADDIRRALSTTPYGETLPGVAVEPERTESRLHRPDRAMGAKALLSSAERRAISLAAHGPQHGEEEGVGYPDGKPHYARPVQDVLEVWNDPGQQATSKNGSAKLRAQMGWPPKENTHQ